MSKRNTDHTNKPEKKPAATAPKLGKVAVAKTRTIAPKAEKKVPAEVKGPAINDTEHPLTENKMEVHHHPELHHKHKPWKEYLLEGLMIFIAVMMGFIAEKILPTSNTLRS